MKRKKKKRLNKKNYNNQVEIHADMQMKRVNTENCHST